MGWNLPPGCSVRDIEDAAGPDAIEDCLGCGAELTEENDPDCLGLCSGDCLWLAIGNQMARAEADRLEADAMASEISSADLAADEYFGRRPS